MTDDNARRGLAALGFDEGWLEAFQALDDEAVSPGRVGRVDRGVVDVHLTSGVVRATPYDSVALAIGLVRARSLRVVGS